MRRLLLDTAREAILPSGVDGKLRSFGGKSSSVPMNQSSSPMMSPFSVFIFFFPNENRTLLIVCSY